MAPSLTPSPEPDADPSTHPEWCSAEHCRRVAFSGPEHHGVPLTYRTSADDVEIMVQRHQFGDTPGEAYRVTIERLDVHEGTIIELTDADVAVVVSMFGLLRN